MSEEICAKLLTVPQQQIYGKRKIQSKNRNGFSFDGSKFKKIYAAYSRSLILRKVKGLEFEKKLKFQSFFSLRRWFCPSLFFAACISKQKNPILAYIKFTVFNRHTNGIAFSANTVSKRV